MFCRFNLLSKNSSGFCLATCAAFSVLKFLSSDLGLFTLFFAGVLASSSRDKASRYFLIRSKSFSVSFSPLLKRYAPDFFLRISSMNCFVSNFSSPEPSFLATVPFCIILSMVYIG